MSVLWSVLAGIGTVLLFLLKGVGILLLVVLVLGLLLMFCPFCADVQWAEGIFQVKAGALGITFPVFRYPAPEKPEKKKKEKKKKASGAQKPKKEAPPRQKAKLTLQIVCTILKGAGKLTRAIIGSLRFTRIDVVLGVRGEDPAEAARSYGRLNAWLYPTLGFLDRFLYLDFEQLRLLPDFGSAEPTVKDHVSFRVTARATPSFSRFCAFCMRSGAKRYWTFLSSSGIIFLYGASASRPVQGREVVPWERRSAPRYRSKEAEFYG